MRQFHRIAIVLVLTVLACDPLGDISLGTGSSCTNQFEKGQGDKQVAPANSTLPIELIAYPYNDGWFCWGPTDARVQWSVESGGGSVTVNDTLSTRAVWTLGPTVGEQTIRATWTNPVALSGPAFVVFTATAVDPNQAIRAAP